MSPETRSADRERPEERPGRDFYRLVPPPEVRSDLPLQEILTSLQDECGPTLSAILLFGSRLVGSGPDRHSAYDLVLVVDDYADLYRWLAAAGRLHHRPWLFTLLSHVLPPTNISYRVAPGSPYLAKCMILSRRHLEDALSPTPPDHFCLSRLVHRVALLHARTPEEEERMIAVLAGGRRTALSWVAPFVDEPFDLGEFTRTMFRVAFGGEIRPETGDRSTEVLRSQHRFLECVYGPLLEKAIEDGLLFREGMGLRYTDPPSAMDRLRWRLYFRWSLGRSTARWFKHMLTFEGWLDYIHRKVQRRMGMEVEITRLERRYPLIFLWPKLVRVLRARRRNESDGERPECDHGP